MTVLTGCGSALFGCRCKLPAGHESDHECVCGGRWDAAGEPSRLPQRIVEWSDDPAFRRQQELVCEIFGLEAPAPVVTSLQDVSDILFTAVRSGKRTIDEVADALFPVPPGLMCLSPGEILWAFRVPPWVAWPSPRPCWWRRLLWRLCARLGWRRPVWHMLEAATRSAATSCSGWRPIAYADYTMAGPGEDTE